MYLQSGRAKKLMPFESEAQRKWMYANKPKMAKKWEKHTPKGKKLPKRKHKSESLNSRIDAVLEGRRPRKLPFVNPGFNRQLANALADLAEYAGESNAT